MSKAKPITISVSTVAECAVLMDITERHWPRLAEQGIAFTHEDGTPDFPRSCVAYIRYLRDGVNADAKEVRKRKQAAEMRIAERKDAEGAGELVPAAMVESSYMEARDKICLSVSRMKALTNEQMGMVVEAIKAVELEPLEFMEEKE